MLFNPGTRKTAVWFLHNTVFTGSAFGPTLPAGWTLRDAIDFSSDGKPDFLLANTSTRRTALWYLNGAVLAGSAFGPAVAAGYSLAFP